MQKKEFTLKKRGLYYHYSFYVDKKRCWKTTNCSSYSDAFNFCIKLLQEERLNPKNDKLFKDYASSFFDDNSLFMKDVKLRSTKKHQVMSYTYLITCKQIVNNHLIPLFGNKSLKEIKPYTIIESRIILSEQGKSNHTINNIISVLGKILETAYQNGLINQNPVKALKQLYEDENKKGTFTIEEAKNIFTYSWENEESRTFNLVAALTGARLSEINAFRRENLHENYIEVTDQFLKGQLRPTKTQKTRIIPLCPEVYNLIESNLKNDIFCDDLSEARPSNDLRTILIKNIPEIRKEKSLSFHSWRHFFNTYLLSQNIAPIKVASVLGHSTKDISSMTMRYCNFTVDDFGEIIEAQKVFYHLLCD